MFLINVHISMIFNALRALIYQISLTQMCEHVLGLLQWTITMMQWLELLLRMWRVLENSVTVWHHWWWWIHSAKGVKSKILCNMTYTPYMFQMVWHYKEPPLLKDYKYYAKVYQHMWLSSGLHSRSEQLKPSPCARYLGLLNYLYMI